MPRITIDLLRKRSEHNECMLSTLEEISLHQEELEKIEVIGTLCRKLRILYLQNNIIEKMEDFIHMKDLRYLNLALNNIKMIEGLQQCEFLQKLDLTLNFIHYDTLQESINHLKPLKHLKELYMMGNPCQVDWEVQFREYVAAALPQLETLDGKEITKSDRIIALQNLTKHLQHIAAQSLHIHLEREQKEQEEKERLELISKDSDVIEIPRGCTSAIDISNPKPSIMASKDKVLYTPENRKAMYMEIAEQKEEEEARKRENMPRERDTILEHKSALEAARRQDANDDENHNSVRQCNEGKWTFRIEDHDVYFILELDLPRFLDTSLIDVDVHPSFVSIVAKNKVFRLKFPERVHSDSGKAERSKVTGVLKLTLPKAETTPTQRLRAQLKEENEKKAKKSKTSKHKNSKKSSNSWEPDSEVDNQNLRKKLSDEVIEAASKCQKSVSIRGIVKNKQLGDDGQCEMKALRTICCQDPISESENQSMENDVPPLLY